MIRAKVQAQSFFVNLISNDSTAQKVHVLAPLISIPKSSVPAALVASESFYHCEANSWDGLAIQLKVNEVVAAMQGASNRLIDVEDLSEEELHLLRTHSGC